MKSIHAYTNVTAPKRPWCVADPGFIAMQDGVGSRRASRGGVVI